MTQSITAKLIPFFRPTRHSRVFALVLILVLLLLVLTGLGVFRLYFDFDYAGGAASDSGQLFSLKIRGGNSFNLFAARPLGSAFWTSQLIIFCMAVLLPWFRPLGGAILALATVAAIVTINFPTSTGLDAYVPPIPLEFLVLMVFVLYAAYLLMSYMAEVRDRKRFAGLLSQYVPPELASAYAKNPASMGLEGEERIVSVLFCDVVGFSTVSEKLEPQQVAQWLNAFFSSASRAIVRHQGTIDKFMGDSVMAFWGAPAKSDTHVFDALAAANDMQAEMQQLSAQFERDGLPPIQVGIGVSTGKANVGNMGSEHRMAYTVVGDTVNVAQRVEQQTRLYDVPVVVSGSVAEAMPGMLFRELDTVPVKGRKAAVKIYQPLGTMTEANADLVANLKKHREAMTAVKSCQWDRATRLFTELKEEFGPALTYDRYLRGIEKSREAAKRRSTSG